MGDLGRFNEAKEMNEELVRSILNNPRINGIQRIFYRIAWNAFEMIGETKMPEENDIFRHIGRKAFQMSEVFAEFVQDSHLKAFLAKRKEKYLT